MHCKITHQDLKLHTAFYFDDNWKAHDYNGCAAITIYWDDGITIKCAIHFEHGKQHSQIVGQPSHESFCENGSKVHLEFYINGQLHNPNGAAHVDFYKNGNKRYEAYWINDNRHRVDGPAIIMYCEDGNIDEVEYFLNGKSFTEDAWKTEVAKLNALAANISPNKDYPCPHCQRSVNTSEKECWCCGGTLGNKE